MPGPNRQPIKRTTERKFGDPNFFNTTNADNIEVKPNSYEIDKNGKSRLAVIPEDQAVRIEFKLS